MTGELRRDAETQEYSREESHVTTEVKIGVMLPQTKEHLRLQLGLEVETVLPPIEAGC